MVKYGRTTRGKRHMPKYVRPGRHSRRQRVRFLWVFAAIFVLGIVLTVTVLVVRKDAAPDFVVASAGAAPIAPISVPTETAPIAPTSVPTETAPIAPTSASAGAATITSTAEPVLQTKSPKYRVVMPTPIAEGYLPIFQKGETNEKIIAITVDDFFQFENARKIIDCAIENGAKLTIFPIGKNAVREGLKDTIRYAHENGMEIENHTYEHRSLYKMNDEAMARQIYFQCLSIDSVLGVDYQEHFFRPMGGDGRDDQRTHQYVKQLGMYGIAHWSVSGSGTGIHKLIDTLEPGNIYLFHTTDADTKKLEKLIPAAIEAGYTLVTLNEMFGFPDNEVTELTKDINKDEIPSLEPYAQTPRTYEKGNFIWQVNIIQQRLNALGYLNEKADGVYGDATAHAIGNFQKAAGIEVTGKADPATQEALFSDDAKAR